MHKQTALHTTSLSVGYTNHVLFNNLNLSLSRGQLVCFMGPNGIGKSSLIRTLTSLQKPLAGKVFLDGKNQQHVEPGKIAVVLTDKITAANMTVYELITFGRYPYTNWKIKLSEEDLAAVDRAIASVHLQALTQKRISALSDGQLQMVMIARAIAQDTPVILLDEPTAHLDLNNRVEIMKLLRSLAHDMNKAILVATHELDLALQTSDLIWLTGKDKNILTGIPEDLVLNGSFDDIFQFKGFDLKTGKIRHEAHKEEIILLTGKGYEYLWTKNALERSGFEVVADASAIATQRTVIHITVEVEESKPHWLLQRNNQQYKLSSLEALVQEI